jgi:D-3-phosphoglycerate dehydrogenase
MPVQIVVPDDVPIALTGTPAETQLRRIGQVRLYNEQLAAGEDELADRLGEAEVALILKGISSLSARVLARCPRLTLISRWGTGVERIDLDYCRRRGIAVAYTPNNDSDEMAEHAIALTLALLRRIPDMDRAIRDGRWPGDSILGARGLTFGVVGLGAIGSRTAQLARALGMSVLAWSFTPDRGRAAALGAASVGLDELVERAHVVSLHLRVSEETRNLMNRSRLQRMRRGSYLVNTARAALVDRDALLEALASGQLAGAGLDVFHQEPLPPTDPLVALPNVILTPHNGGLIAAVIARGLRRAVENVENYLAGRKAELLFDPRS